MPNSRIKILYKNRLPHIAPIGATFFVTFRLHDSLPAAVVAKLKSELVADLRRENKGITDSNQIRRVENALRKKYFRAYDHQLDHSPYGRCYLAIPEVARAVIDRLFEFDNILFQLEAFCLMPNHVHVLFSTRIQLIKGGFKYDNDPFEGRRNYAHVVLDTTIEIENQNYIQLHQIMQLIKGGSARVANTLLDRSGAFWFKDSYDHYVRHSLEWSGIARYILENPVKARLSNVWQDWPYSYFKYE